MRLLIFTLLTGVMLLVCASKQVIAASTEVTAGKVMNEEIGTLKVLDTNQQAKTIQEDEMIEAVVTEILSESRSDYSDSQINLSQEVKVLVTHGSIKGKSVEVSYNRLLSQGEKPLQTGDRIMLNRSPGLGEGNDLFYVVDYIRTPALLVLFVIFVGMVLMIGKMPGLQSLIGMGLSFVILFTVLIPGIKAGYDPILVTVAASALIMLFTFYMSHGLNQKTTWAMVGTFIALVLTAILAKIFVNLTRLTGFASEEAVFIQFLQGGQLNVQGILLAGIIIGALGVLDDITISQSSIVYELRRANPKLSVGELFTRAMRVGRDHISSLANTLVLVYVGSSLPLLLIFTFDKSRTFTTVLSYEVVAEEVVRTLVGSIGLIAAVPVTTFLAAKYGFRQISTSATKQKQALKGSNKHFHFH